MGDRWWEAEQPCMSFSCSNEGIQTVAKVCPEENCQEVLNPSTAATTVTQYLTCDVVLTDFCDTRRIGSGIINTAALHVSPIKTCENWKTCLIIIGWVRGERWYTGVTGNQSCAPKLTSMNVTVGNCSSVALMPVCQGQCASGQRWDGDGNITESHFTCISHPPGVPVAQQGRVWRQPAGGADTPVLPEAKIREEIFNPAVPGPHEQNTLLWAYHRVWLQRLCCCWDSRRVTGVTIQIQSVWAFYRLNYSKEHLVPNFFFQLNNKNTKNFNGENPHSLYLNQLQQK